MQSRASYATELSLFKRSATTLKGPLELSLLDEPATNLKTPLTYSLILHIILFLTLICFAVFSRQRETWRGRTSEQGTKVIYWPPFATFEKVPYLRKLLMVPKPAPRLTWENYKNYSPGNGIGGGALIGESIFLIDGRRGAGMIEVKVAGFASQYPNYVEAVQRRVSNNWPESTSSVPLVCIATFTILRNGTITNIRVTQSTRNQLADMSVVHAIEDSNPLDHLPNGYAGASTSVEFQFDFRRPQ
jgi:TonB family protein